MCAARTHGPPGPVELPGVDRLSCRPAFQQTVRTTRATTTRAGCAQRSLPVPSMLQRCPILGGSDGSRPRRAVARRLSYDRTQGRMGARVMASGMPGASRRAVLGGATYSVVKVRVRLRGAVRPGSVTISATSLARVQSAPCPFGLEWITCWTRLKLALVGSIAQAFWGVSRKGWLSRRTFDKAQAKGNAIRSTTMKRPCEGHEGARGGLSGLKHPLQFVRAAAE